MCANGTCSGRVLELGCGSGYVSCSLALMMQHMCLQAQMLAVDHSPAAVEATCKTLQNHKVSDASGGSFATLL